ncbi:MAG: DUF456 domain-containing protein [Usitatibacter sp.]
MDPNVYLAFAAILVIAGLVGTVVPVFPGVLFVFAGLFLAAWAEGFSRVGAVGLSIIGFLALLGLAADFVASLLGAKRVGASPLALAGAAAGGFVGIFFGIAGLVAGPFLGAVLGELWARRDLMQAGKVGLGTTLGLLAAALAKVVLAFLMIATFLAFYFLTLRT